MTHRLVVEISDRNYQTLTKASEEEEMNKTTITGRAISLYGLISGRQHDGWVVQLANPSTGEVEILRLLS